MSENRILHVPSPEFRARLERDVVDGFRRQSQFSAPPGAARRARWRTAATLVLGLSLGVGGAVATAQVQSAKVRDSLMVTNEMNRKIAAMRLELAKAEFESVSKAVKAGVRPEGDLSAARLSVLTAETALQRVGLEIEETQLTGMPSRDELWAPLIGKRDFVSNRLYFDLLVGGQQQYAAEAGLDDARTRARVGIIKPSDTLEAAGTLQRIYAELRLVNQKRELRKSFLEKTLTEEQISAKLQFYELQQSMVVMMTKLQQAGERAKRARELQVVGLATVVDLKRAELDSLESAQAAERLNTMLKLAEQAQLRGKATDSLKKKR